MKDPSSVIAQATDGIGVKLAREFEVSVGRMYEILGKDNPLPRAKKLIRAIGRVDETPDKARVRVIKADVDSMFEDILGRAEAVDEPCVRVLHKEAFEAIDAQLEGKPAGEQLKELRDLLVVVEQMIEGRERLTAREANGNIREWSREVVNRRMK